MNDCSCTVCQSACEHKPGWFLPAEVEPAAKFLGLSVEDFFKKYLLVDWFGADGRGVDHDIFVLSPAVVGSQPGGMFAADPRGVCVFFEDGRCTIHAVKPYECAQAHHDDTEEENGARHQVELPRAWDVPAVQAEVTRLLGREPNSVMPLTGTLLDLLVDLARSN